MINSFQHCVGFAVAITLQHTRKVRENWSVRIGCMKVKVILDNKMLVLSVFFSLYISLGNILEYYVYRNRETKRKMTELSNALTPFIFNSAIQRLDKDTVEYFWWKIRFSKLYLQIYVRMLLYGLQRRDKVNHILSLRKGRIHPSI